MIYRFRHGIIRPLAIFWLIVTVARVVKGTVAWNGFCRSIDASAQAEQFRESMNQLFSVLQDRRISAPRGTLLRFTEQGAKKLKESTIRAHNFDQIAAKAGVKIEGQYWTVGAYDGVVILSADSEQQALKCLSRLASEGNVRTETMQAFIDQEFDEIVGR